MHTVKDDMFKVLRYNVKQHGKVFQTFLDQHIIPKIVKRMGLRADQQLQYSDVEPLLDPKAAYSKKLTDFSIVLIDSENGNLIGCQSNYIFPKKAVLEDAAGLQAIVDQTTKGDIVHEYCKHRVKMWLDIANIIDKYSNTDRAFYIESTIVHPSLRNKGISSKLHEESLKVAGPKELVILEGMMPKDRWGISKPSTLERFKMGFKLDLVVDSHDGYACPIYFRPPLNN